MAEKIPLESFSFTTQQSEAAAIYFMLKSEGLEPNSQGIKTYLLTAAGVLSDIDEEDDASDEASKPEDLSETVKRILDAAERNPEVTEYALKKGAQLLGTFLKRLA